VHGIINHHHLLNLPKLTITSSFLGVLIDFKN